MSGDICCIITITLAVLVFTYILIPESSKRNSVGRFVGIWGWLILIVLSLLCYCLVVPCALHCIYPTGESTSRVVEADIHISNDDGLETQVDEDEEAGCQRMIPVVEVNTVGGWDRELRELRRNSGIDSDTSRSLASDQGSLTGTDGDHLSIGNSETTNKQGKNPTLAVARALFNSNEVDIPPERRSSTSSVTNTNVGVDGVLIRSDSDNTPTANRAVLMSIMDVEVEGGSTRGPRSNSSGSRAVGRDQLVAAAGGSSAGAGGNDSD